MKFNWIESLDAGPVGDAEEGPGGAGLVLGHLDVGAERVRDAGPALHVEQAREDPEPEISVDLNV